MDITHHSEDLLIIHQKNPVERSIATFRFNKNRTNGTLTSSGRYWLIEKPIINRSLSDIRDVIVEGAEYRTGLRSNSSVGTSHRIAIVFNDDKYLYLPYNFSECLADYEEIVTCIKGFLKI